MRFTGKTVLVTGGSEGIGFAIAKALIDEGARVTLVARREDKLAEAARSLGERASYVAGDARDPALAEHAVDEAVRRHGALDMLVNNAGVLIPGNLLDQPLEDVDQMLALNLRGAILFTRAAAQRMRGRKGAAVLMISSNTGLYPGAGTGIYGATKAALQYLTQTWAIELAEAGIRVNCLCPGPTQTPAFAHVASRIPNFEKIVLKTTLIKRMSSPEEVARPALMLLDEHEGGYITGAIWQIDGGASLGRAS